ncbi:MAG: MinD/ParA family protein [Chloroflexi bacterium]|nr:MinD/ParA family protein [Chloroflexota bacterium]
MTDEKIRVLIVDDIAETRENIRKLLQFETDVEVVGAARTGAEGIQLAGESEPDVVLMDINMPDMDGIAATEAIRSKYPATQIVILSVQSDANYMRRAMLAGARDFLTKPPDVDELTAAIRRAGEMAQSERAKRAASTMMVQSSGPATGPLVSMPHLTQGKVITIYGPKGGTGSTTLAANLAVAMHSSETPVSVADANLQFGDLSFFFNEQGKNNIADLAPRANELDAEIVDDVIIEHADSGIKILAAPMRPEHAESVTGEQFGSVIKFLRQMYSYVIVDTASLLTDVTLAVLDVSDIIVLITTQDIPAIKNARLFLDLANALSLDRERILMVMNRFDKRRTNITPAKVSDNFKQEFAAVVPVDEKLVIPAMDRGIPFMLQNKSHPVSRAILQLAENTRKKINELEEMEAEHV